MNVVTSATRDENKTKLSFFKLPLPLNSRFFNSAKSSSSSPTRLELFFFELSPSNKFLFLPSSFFDLQPIL